MFRKITNDSATGFYSYAGTAIAWLAAWAAAPTNFTILVPIVVPATGVGDYANTTLKRVFTLVSGNGFTPKETLALGLYHSATGTPGTIRVRSTLTTTAGSTNADANISEFDLNDLAAKTTAGDPIIFWIAITYTKSGSNHSTKVRACFPSDLAITDRTITSTLIQATSSTVAGDILGASEAADFISFGGTSTTTNKHNGAHEATNNRKGQQLWVGSAVIYADEISDAHLQAVVDMRDPGAFYVLDKAAGSVSTGPLWFENCCMIADNGGQANFTDGTDDTALNDPNAQQIEAGIRVFDSAQTSSPDLSAGLVGIPTAGDAQISDSSNTIKIERPRYLGARMDATLPGLDGINLSGRPDHAGQAPNLAKWAAGTVTPGIVMVTGNSRANSTRSTAHPTSLTYRSGLVPTEVSKINTTDLSYASDYATTLGGDITAIHSVGLGIAMSEMTSGKFGGYAHSIRNIDQPGPFLDRATGGSKAANAGNVRGGSSGHNNNEGDNIADWSRACFSGPNSDNGAGLGLGEAMYLNPSTGAASTYREITVAPAFDRNPEDPLKMVVLLLKAPGLSDDVRVERGYRDSGGSWVRVDDATTGVDLSDNTGTATVNAYTADATSITLNGASSGAQIDAGGAFVWRRGTTDYFGIGIYDGGAAVVEFGGNMTLGSLEFPLGSTWVSGATQGFPKSGDSVWLGELNYVAIEVEFSAAELDGTTGTFDNNYPGVRVYNEGTDGPVIIPQIIPITVKAGCITMIEAGQAGGGYDEWNGADTPSNKRQFDTTLGTGGLESTPFGRYMAALAGNLRGVVMMGATQTNGTDSIIRILDTIKAGAPAADRAMIAGRALPPTGEVLMTPTENGTSDGYWGGVYDAVTVHDATIPIVLSTMNTCGHPMSQYVDGWCFDNPHQSVVGAIEEGYRVATAMQDASIFRPFSSAGGASFRRTASLLATGVLR